MALAPDRFVDWLSANKHKDRRFGHVYRYHSRSDAHSVALCKFIWSDLLDTCPVLRSQAERGEIVCGINARFRWRATDKSKAFDLVVGTPVDTQLVSGTDPIVKAELRDVFLSCEAKSVMTEHGKSQPRVYDELNSSYRIVHEGRQEAIAAGITVVNIAGTFVSPLRQTASEELYISEHKQPWAAAKMVEHLRGLTLRNGVGQEGFDAYATIVVDCDNQGPVELWSDLPAPQAGDDDHYETFLQRISDSYSERFSEIPG